MLLNLADYEDAARDTLEAGAFDFVAGGAYDERTIARNRSAFDELTLNPRYVRDVSRRALATTVLGEEISFPVFVSPAGLQKRLHRDGIRATVEGAGRSRTLTIVPAWDLERPDELVDVASGPLWLQVYHRDRDATERLVRLAEESGCRAICLTCDAPFPQPKERDLRNGLLVLEGGARARVQLQVTWRDVEWLRGLTSLPLVLKGLNAAADARLAVESGVDGILVSTHGGRLLDSTLGAVEYLPGVVDAVAGRAEVYLDSGVRRGGDVLKALALGARGVGIGRPFCWGLAVGGADGVHAVLELLRNELDVNLAFCGQTAVTELEPELVNRPPGWGRRG